MLARVNSDKTEAQILVVLQGPWYHMASQTYASSTSSSMCLVCYTFFFKLNCSWLNAKHVCWPSLVSRFQIHILTNVIQTQGHGYSTAFVPGRPQAQLTSLWFVSGTPTNNRIPYLACPPGSWAPLKVSLSLLEFLAVGGLDQ